MLDLSALFVSSTVRDALGLSSELAVSLDKGGASSSGSDLSLACSGDYPAYEGINASDTSLNQSIYICPGQGMARWHPVKSVDLNGVVVACTNPPEIARKG